MAAVYTLAEAQQQLREWHKALEACQAGQFYTIGGQQLSRQEIPNIRAEIQRWHNTVRALEQKAAGQVRPLGAQAAFGGPGRGGDLISQSLWEDWRT